MNLKRIFFVRFLPLQPSIWYSMPITALQIIFSVIASYDVRKELILTFVQFPKIVYQIVYH